MTITVQEFDLFKKYIEEQCGIVFQYGKEYVLEPRLTPLMKQSGASSYIELYQMLQKDAGELNKKLIDAVTTNVTFWFRDESFYNALSNKVFPMLMGLAKVRKVRIWSAACSTGQEPYSLAILINEAKIKAGAGAPPSANFEIVATDISPSAIFKAVSGRYSKLDISGGMKKERLLRYFEQDGNAYKLSSEIKSMVKFKQLNLMESFSSLGAFDLVLCRNVLFYFPGDVKKSVYAQLHRALTSSGLLCVNGSEVLKYNFSAIRIHNVVFYRPSVPNGAPGKRPASLSRKIS